MYLHDILVSRESDGEVGEDRGVAERGEAVPRGREANRPLHSSLPSTPTMKHTRVKMKTVYYAVELIYDVEYSNLSSNSPCIHDSLRVRVLIIIYSI